MYNILLVEDEEKVANVIKSYLQKENFNVYSTSLGLKALELFNEVEFKLVILDLMLPDISGEEVCRALRRMSDVHIFMVTAKSSVEEKIEGLDIGADEYLTKPFSPRELTARVKALFRRVGGGEKSKVLSFNGNELQIDKEKRVITIKGKNVPFTPNEFDILYTIASSKGNVLTREQLIEKVFGIDFEGTDRTVDVHIKNIRKKIEEDSRNPKYIITVPRYGYKFGGEF